MSARGFSRHQILAIWYLPAGRGGNHERTSKAIGP
jgi:hypothetical protein